jgi:sporulation protein YlmC with PRC-barrel domain
MGTSTQNNLEPVLISRNQTAHGLIGEDVINNQGQKIATVKDIILDRDGKAILVVVSDHGFLGIGSKVAAFDYSRVFTQNPDGNVVMGLSQDMVDRAADFSYDQKDWAKAKIIPNGSVSVKNLLNGVVFDNNGKKVADVDNIYLRNSEAAQVIVSFNKTMGMGGELAALNYDDLQKIQKNKDIDFKLTPKQSAQFANFKESAKY